MSEQKKPQIHQQFDLYLEKMGLQQSQMNDVQYIETRRAFYAGFGQLLILLLGDIADMPEEESINTLDDLFTESQEFFKNEAYIQFKDITLRGKEVKEYLVNNNLWN